MEVLLPSKMLLLAVLAVPATGFAQTSAANQQRIPEVVAIDGTLVNGAYVMTANGTVQAYVCPAPKRYATAGGQQGWACFDPATGVWLLGALPPPSAPPMAALPPVVEGPPAFGSADPGAQQQQQQPPNVVYVEAPPRIVYIEAPPQVVYVEPPAPQVVYVEAPPTVIIVERNVGRRGDRDRDREEPAPAGFAVAPAFTNSPAFVSRPAFVNPGSPAPAADSRRDGERGRDGRRDGGTAAADSGTGQRGTGEAPRGDGQGRGNR